MGERTPLIQDRNDIVVQATLHRCAYSIQTELDGEQIITRLEQERIMPLAAVPDVNTVQTPDNPGRLANNIRLWMHNATREEFERFIAIVKEMGEGSQPLEELGQKLEEEYLRLSENPAEAQEEARRFNKGIVEMIKRIQPTSSIDILCSTCYCKLFLPLIIIYIVLLIVSSPIIYFRLWTIPLAPQPVDPLPTLISGTTTVEIKLGREVSTVTVSLNCPGQVLVTNDFPCSNLSHVSTSWQSLHSPMQHLLAGSQIHLSYEPNLSHNFAIVQNLETYRQKCSCTSSVFDLCFSSASPPSQEVGDEECMRECQRDKLCPSTNTGSSKLNDIMCLSNASFYYTVADDDFYFIQLGSQCPDRKSVKAISYSISELSSGSYKNFTLSRSELSSPYSATLDLSDNDADNRCVLLDVQCLSDRAAYDIKYNITMSPVTASNVRCFLAWGVMAAVGLFLAAIQAITFCWRFSRRRKKLHDPADTIN